MPSGDIYLWGCAGGLGAAVFVYVLPEIRQATFTDTYRPTRRHVVRMAFLVLALAAVAGLVAVMADARTPAGAVGWGFASDAFLKALLSAGRDYFPPGPPPG